MNNHPYTLDRLTVDHRRALLDQAANARLVTEARSVHTRQADPTARVRAGWRLWRRPVPVPAPLIP